MLMKSENMCEMKIGNLRSEFSELFRIPLRDKSDIVYLRYAGLVPPEILSSTVKQDMDL